ncbi:MAG: type II toxin-antitoxin system RelE/ParE family toxin [Planctomycetales bacterium]|nr:type II toxin-antitoxin system RelE/ParE family toxin [Planctomycetales bacterium]
MPTLRYSDASKEDLKEIARFIAKDKPLAARQWIDKLRAKCRFVARNPEIGDVRHEFGPNIRSTYLGSYVIFFRRNSDAVEIVRIVRGERDRPLL